MRKLPNEFSGIKVTMEHKEEIFPLKCSNANCNMVFRIQAFMNNGNYVEQGTPLCPYCGSHVFRMEKRHWDEFMGIK